MSFMHPEIAEAKTTSSPLKKIRVGHLIKALKNGDIDTAFPIYGSY